MPRVGARQAGRLLMSALPTTTPGCCTQRGTDCHKPDRRTCSSSSSSLPRPVSITGDGCFTVRAGAGAACFDTPLPRFARFASRAGTTCGAATSSPDSCALELRAASELCWLAAPAAAPSSPLDASPSLLPAFSDAPSSDSAAKELTLNGNGGGSSGIELPSMKEGGAADRARQNGLSV